MSGMRSNSITKDRKPAYTGMHMHRSLTPGHQCAFAIGSLCGDHSDSAGCRHILGSVRCVGISICRDYITHKYIRTNAPLCCTRGYPLDIHTLCVCAGQWFNYGLAPLILIVLKLVQVKVCGCARRRTRAQACDTSFPHIHMRMQINCTQLYIANKEMNQPDTNTWESLLYVSRTQHR